jgi:hypothetical protein
MKALDEESRVKDESIGAKVKPFEGPASGSCCIAATAAMD